MNQRIQELALECYNPYSNFDINKFAKLIIQECADIASKNQAEDMNWDIAEIIKEHFGVEE